MPLANNDALIALFEALYPDNGAGLVAPEDLREGLAHLVNYVDSRAGFSKEAITQLIQSELMPLEPLLQQILAATLAGNGLLFDAGRERTDADFRALNVNSVVGNFPAFPDAQDFLVFPGIDAAGKPWFLVEQYSTNVAGVKNLVATRYKNENGVDFSNPPTGFRLVLAGGTGGGTIDPPPAITRPLSVKTMLYAAIPLGGAVMGKPLQDLGLIPTNSEVAYPNTVAEWTNVIQDSVPAGVATIGNVVDWVVVELRDANDISVKLEARAGLLLTDNRIVNSAGNPLEFAAPAGSYYIAVKHRNHLAIGSATPIAMVDSVVTSYDFTTDLAKYYPVPTNSGAPAAKQTSNTTFAMHPGNAGGNRVTVNQGAIKSDRTEILAALGNDPNATLTNVYNNADINFDGKVDYDNKDNISTDFGYLNLVALDGGTVSGIATAIN